MEVEERYYSMAPNSCVLTLYVGHVCSSRSSLDAVKSGQAFAEWLGGVDQEAGVQTGPLRHGVPGGRARPGLVCSGRKPSGRGKKARAKAATLLTTTAAAVDPAPTKMTARARATATTTAAAVRTAADAKARAALEGGEAARDRWQGPEGGREQLDEQRGERRREGGRRRRGGREGARQGPLQRAINSSKAWKHY